MTSAAAAAMSVGTAKSAGHFQTARNPTGFQARCSANCNISGWMIADHPTLGQVGAQPPRGNTENPGVRFSGACSFRDNNSINRCSKTDGSNLEVLLRSRPVGDDTNSPSEFSGISERICRSGSMAIDPRARNEASSREPRSKYPF